MLTTLTIFIVSSVTAAILASGVVIIGSGIAERVHNGYGDDDLIDRPEPYRNYEKSQEQIEYLCRVRREAKMRGEHIC